MNPRNVLFAVTAVVGLVLDQATKWWVVHNLPEGTGEIVVIPGFFSIVHARNPGAAFGMLRDFEYRHWVFLAFTIVAGFVIADMFRKLKPNDGFMGAALGLVLSGAIGNAIDRVLYRFVTDFLRVYIDTPSVKQWLIATFGTYEWPSFNVADAALVVGIGMFVIHQLFLEKKEAPAPPTAGTRSADEEPTEPRAESKAEPTPDQPVAG
ncbi:MAG: signal peptidase II [Alphaproteobacteria bacterium]|nr:signal peptidase II [Alphaproteobacteria bacterium]MCB9699216.1 signal peptidase II [Alphaproteobacteria bacterium]